MTKVREAEYNMVKIIIKKPKQCSYDNAIEFPVQICMCEEWITLGHAINSVVGLISRVFLIEL